MCDGVYDIIRLWHQALADSRQEQFDALREEVKTMQVFDLAKSGTQVLIILTSAAAHLTVCFLSGSGNGRITDAA